MPTEPKPTSPPYYWLVLVTELQELLDPDDERYAQVYNLLVNSDYQLLDVNAFCAVEPGNPGDITTADLLDGTWKEKYIQAAKQAAFYKLCQDA